jgi:hypothetical protein
MPTDDPEAPEADALEQDQVVEEHERRVPPSADPEAPEADALEQSTEVLGEE